MPGKGRIELLPEIDIGKILFVTTRGFEAGLKSI